MGPMKILDDLREEHALIERVVGSLRTFAATSGNDPADAAAYLRFFRLFARRFHHAREEEVLFPALVATEVPKDRGPLKVLLDAHHAIAQMLDAMDPGVTLPLAERYGRALLTTSTPRTRSSFPRARSGCAAPAAQGFRRACRTP